MRLSMITAVSRNGVIGRDNGLPWNLPKDLEYFKETTADKPVIMGRKTFESIGRPLPGRDNIVISQSPDLKERYRQVTHAESVQEALLKARAFARARSVNEIFVIGGETIYRQFMPVVSRIYLTVVEADVEGDAYFPALMGEWERVSSKELSSGELGIPDCRVEVWERIGHDNRVAYKNFFDKEPRQIGEVEILESPLELNQLLTAMFFMPIDENHEPVELSEASKLIAYRISDSQSFNLENAIPASHRRVLQEYGLVLPRQQKQYYQLEEAVAEITMRQYLILTKHLMRAPWEDLIIRR